MELGGGKGRIERESEGGREGGEREVGERERYIERVYLLGGFK